MIKQLLVAAILFIFTACGQQENNSPETTGTDSAGKTIASDTGKINVVAAAGKTTIQSPVASTDLSSFIPAGYSMLDTASGDLNLDSLPDKVLVIKKDGEDSTSDVVDHPEKRPLLLLIGQPDNTYQLAARSDNAVLCVDCGGMMGDPFENVVIKKGYFSVQHYGGSAWRWSRIITFKYVAEDKSWYLHKDGHISYHTSDPDKTEEKIYTTKDFGKLPFANFDVYKEQ